MDGSRRLWPSTFITEWPIAILIAFLSHRFASGGRKKSSLRAQIAPTDSPRLAEFSRDTSDLYSFYRLPALVAASSSSKSEPSSLIKASSAASLSRAVPRNVLLVLRSSEICMSKHIFPAFSGRGFSWIIWNCDLRPGGGRKTIFHTIKAIRMELGLGALKCKFHDIDSINWELRTGILHFFCLRLCFRDAVQAVQ